jgi:MFS transporter, DHA2 family, multidrug resistance protein
VNYLTGNASGNLEAWEQEEARYISASLRDLTPRHKMAILMSVGLITAIEISNRISINVLLPDMQGNVAADSDQISWVIILYNLGFLCSMALATWMTRVLGARRHLLYSLGLYSIGAMGCVLSAHSLELLLVSRLVMGFGGGAFLVRTVILSGLMFPGNARMMAVTRLYALLGVFEVFYPVGMGWINDHFHWNYAFLIDFPFLVIGAFLISKLIPRGYLFRRKPDEHVDFRGGTLLILSLVCLQIATSRGERDLWFESPWIGPTLLVALICFIGFLWWDSRIENTSPVFHLRMLWRQATVRTSLSVVLIVGAILGAGLYVLPQYLRFVQDYSATQTGGFISMYTSGLFLSLVLSLRVILPRLGAPLTMAAGLVMMLGTCAAMVCIWTPTTPATILAPAIFMQGFSLGAVLLGAARIATGTAALPDLNDMSTTYFFVRQLGNTLGVTAVTVLFDRRMSLHSARLLDVANRLDPTVRSTLAQYANLIHRNGGGSSNPALGALQLFQASVVTQSRLLSYIDVYFGLGVLAALALVLIGVKKLKYNAAGPVHFHLP